MGRLLLAGVLCLGLSACAAPAWVTATSVAAIAGATGAAFTFNTELVRVWDARHPVAPEPPKP